MMSKGSDPQRKVRYYFRSPYKHRTHRKRLYFFYSNYMQGDRKVCVHLFEANYHVGFCSNGKIS